MADTQWEHSDSYSDPPLNSGMVWIDDPQGDIRAYALSHSDASAITTRINERDALRQDRQTLCKAVLDYGAAKEAVAEAENNHGPMDAKMTARTDAFMHMMKTAADQQDGGGS